MATDERTSNSIRTEYPSGWLAIAENQSVAHLIDALLDLPGHREFTKTELAEMAGVSRQSVHAHLDFLLAMGVVAPVEDTSPQRYRFVPESDVSRALAELDGAVNRVGASAE